MSFSNVLDQSAGSAQVATGPDQCHEQQLLGFWMTSRLYIYNNIYAYLCRFRALEP